MKKLEIEKTKPTFIIPTIKTDIIKVGLVFSISNFFTNKTYQANNWECEKNTFLCEFGFTDHDNIIQNYLDYTQQFPNEILDFGSFEGPRLKERITEGCQSFVDIFCVWDCCWVYIKLSEVRKDSYFAVKNFSYLSYLLKVTQCARTDLNKRFLPKPMTTTGQSKEL